MVRHQNFISELVPEIFWSSLVSSRLYASKKNINVAIPHQPLQSRPTLLTVTAVLLSLARYSLETLLSNPGSARVMWVNRCSSWLMDYSHLKSGLTSFYLQMPPPRMNGRDFLIRMTQLQCDKLMRHVVLFTQCLYATLQFAQCPLTGGRHT